MGGLASSMIQHPTTKALRLAQAWATKPPATLRTRLRPNAMTQTTFTYDCAPSFVHLAYEFTGKERDTESGLDYFGVRYFGSGMGRFMSPDDVGGQGVFIANTPAADKRRCSPHRLATRNPSGSDGRLPVRQTRAAGYPTEYESLRRAAQEVTRVLGSTRLTVDGNFAVSSRYERPSSVLQRWRCHMGLSSIRNSVTGDIAFGAPASSHGLV